MTSIDYTPNAPPVTPRRTGLTTPSPTYSPDLPTPLADRPATVDYHTAQRIRLAAGLATVRYPGPVGQYLSEELHAAASFGYRHSAPTSPLMRIVDHLLG